MEKRFRYTQRLDESEWTPPEQDLTVTEDRLQHWQNRVMEEHPELLRHLVWDSERLGRLEAVVRQVVTEDEPNDPQSLSTIRSLAAVYTRSVVSRLTGIGALEELTRDDEVTEILVNGPGSVYIEREGRLERSRLQFQDADEVVTLAQRLAARAGKSLTTETPECDARLSDGSRIHCVLPPLSEHATICIRRAANPLTRDRLLSGGAMDQGAWELLESAVKARRNVLVAGGASSGKTSLLRVLAGAIPETERLIVIEDVRELRLEAVHPHVVSLETHRQYDLRALVQGALRMRPDRIIVGEVRGPESLDLLEAMATGHPGSLCTMHSRGGGLRTVHRLARMALLAVPNMTFEQMVSQVLDSLDLIVYVERGADGVRRLRAIDQVSPDGLSLLWQPRQDET